MNPNASSNSSPSRGPKRVKVTPEQILDAAQEVFAREGVQGASLRAVARRAGCDPSLIYYHFEHKEALFQALLQRRFLPLLRELAELCSAEDLRPTAKRLWEILLLLRRHLAKDAGFRAMVRGQIVFGAEGVKDSVTVYLLKVQQLFWKLFEQGIQRGDLRQDLKVPLASFFFVRMFMEIHDLVPQLAERMTGVSGEQAVSLAERTWFDYFWRSIAKEPIHLESL